MAHTFVSKSMADLVNTALTHPYTCDAGTTLLLVHLGCRTTTPRTGGDVTYNSVAMTPTPEGVVFYSAGEGTVELWYMTDPPTGAQYNIVVPNDGGLITRMFVSSYAAASGYTSAYDTGSSANGLSANPAVTFTTNYDSEITADILCSGRLIAATANYGVELFAIDEGVMNFDCEYLILSSSQAVTLSWTLPSDDWAIIGGGWREVASGGPPDQTSWGYVSFLHDELANY